MVLSKEFKVVVTLQDMSPHNATILKEKKSHFVGLLDSLPKITLHGVLSDGKSDLIFALVGGIEVIKIHRASKYPFECIVDGERVRCNAHDDVRAELTFNNDLNKGY